MMPSLDKEITKDATAKLMGCIVHGESTSLFTKSRKRRPSRLPKKVRDRLETCRIMEKLENVETNMVSVSEKANLGHP